MWFRRRLPAGRRPGLERDERVVAWAAAGTDQAATVVATNLGLHLPGRPRLGWHEILKAVWDEAALTVVPAVPAEDAGEYTVVADGPATRCVLADPGDLPHQVRTRVTASVAVTVHQAVPGGGARVAGRRVPGADGLSWTVRLDPGTPADGSRAAVAELVRAVRASSTAADL